MNNLILVRHGQSFWNKERRFTGWADIGLTEQGKLEAKNAGKLIRSLNIELDFCFTSKLTRAINSSEIILDILNKKNIQIVKTDLLNERHYGGLTSLNKDDIIKKYGIKQVKIWRRSFETSPPPMDEKHPFKKKINSSILSESLKDTFDRVVPYFEKKIKPLILSKKNILIVFHGNSIRALLMKIFNISKEKIVEFEIPTGNPLLIQFVENFKIKEYKYLNSKRAKKIISNI
ncbi:2,3-diphosphoglycerate-dependent phosphoglycerate mutase [Pelagibacteraceae bacterium]|jgi:2,3-bisphosphoglycerate-dependent phosphoglycerate mutase|nr:2,3-diphosphoglycerate-dependent phosphoglycerate mutase [Pelagibacteraceae bacterium]